jgi:hypothetical protein
MSGDVPKRCISETQQLRDAPPSSKEYPRSASQRWISEIHHQGASQHGLSEMGLRD